MQLRDQDRELWDRALIGEGHDLVRACLRRNHPGPYQIQAAINAVHTDAATAADTDWRQVVQLYDQLMQIAPSPVVAMNRAIAIAELDGPDVALKALEGLPLDHYQPYHSTRADLLRRAGRTADAADEYRKALETHHQRDRAQVPRAPPRRTASTRLLDWLADLPEGIAQRRPQAAGDRRGEVRDQAFSGATDLLHGQHHPRLGVVVVVADRHRPRHGRQLAVESGRHIARGRRGDRRSSGACHMATRRNPDKFDRLSLVGRPGSPVTSTETRVNLIGF